MKNTFKRIQSIIITFSLVFTITNFNQVSYAMDVNYENNESWLISAGTSHSVGLKNDGTVVAVGENYFNQCLVSEWKDIVYITAGDNHTVGLKKDGTVLATGWNQYGQCNVSDWQDIIAVSAGTNQTVGLKKDGTVIIVGTSIYGEYNVSGWKDIVAISAGENHTVGLKGDGTVVAAGDNSNGACDISGWENIIAISAGLFYTVGLKADGTVVSTSGNVYGLNEVSSWRDIVALDAGSFHTVGLRKDGTVISTVGLGSGESYTQSWKDIVSISAGGQFTLGLRKDSTVLACGRNTEGQGGVDNWRDIALPSTVQSKPVSQPAYIYDSLDLGASIVLPIDSLQTITNQSSAVSVIQSAITTLTDSQLHSQTGTDLVTLYAEEAVALSGNQAIEGSNATLNQSTLSALAITSLATKKEAENLLNTSGITTARNIDTAVTIHTTDKKKTDLTIEPSSALIGVDELRVSSPTYNIAVPTTLVQSMGLGGFGVTVTVLKPGEVLMNQPNLFAMTDTGKKARRNATTVEAGTKYVVAIDKALTDNIKISLPPLAGDSTFQAVIKSDGTAVGGKYNPATGMIDVRIKTSDTYMVKNNLKDFSDIQNKSVEMQNAIKVLASKGIIGGTSPTTFSPDSSITRVEIAALILRTLSKLDPKANGSFNDVKTSDWYYGVAGSAKQYGIMNGLSAGIFAPKNTILKEQIIAVAARTLKNEMKYKDPVSVDSILSAYKDKSSIPSWGTKEIALATKENMVVKRTDSNFVPKGSMSRGDAAVILYRLFSKIW